MTVPYIAFRMTTVSEGDIVVVVVVAAALIGDNYKMHYRKHN